MARASRVTTAATPDDVAADLGSSMAAAADGDTSDAGTGTSKLRNVLDYERTKQHKSWLPDIEKDNNGTLFGNADIKELRSFIETITLKLRKYEPAMLILTGVLNRDSEQLSIFGLDLEDFDDTQTILGSDILETFTDRNWITY